MDPFPSVLLTLAWPQARVSDKASRDYKEVLNPEIEPRSWALHGSYPGVASDALCSDAWALGP